MLPPSQRKMRKTSFRTRCSASLDVDEELWRAVVTPNALAVIRAERDQWIDTRRPSSWNPARRCCRQRDRKSTRLNSSHVSISYAVFCLKKKKKTTINTDNH